MTSVCVWMFCFVFLARTWSMHRFLTAAFWAACWWKCIFHRTNQTARHEPEGLEFFEFLSNKDWKTKTDEMLIREYMMLGTVVQFQKLLVQKFLRFFVFFSICFYLKNLKCLFFCLLVVKDDFSPRRHSRNSVCSVFGFKSKIFPSPSVCTCPSHSYFYSKPSC